ncbi:RNA-binding protein 5, putative [Leishmania tarentolae]|uniref:RNA-binding protein 5, putative n=1 Tax=Leishmania tarentolae TaxID=5689 RepID=A0A640KET0_LEITA|nr:RNA-binding protein 5, putative [Leishmania tarentolae]
MPHPFSRYVELPFYDLGHGRRDTLRKKHRYSPVHSALHQWHRVVHGGGHVHDVHRLVWHAGTHQLLLHHHRIHLLSRSLWTSQTHLHACVPDTVALERNHSIQRILFILKQDKAIPLAQPRLLIVLHGTGDDAAKGREQIQ